MERGGGSERREWERENEREMEREWEREGKATQAYV
jgi:hypothetical protein